MCIVSASFDERGESARGRVEVETQEKGNIGNKPGFFACFVSKKQ
jgi:hypothetical protein